MKLTCRVSGTTWTMSPESNAPFPSAPAAQCSIVAPSKWPGARIQSNCYLAAGAVIERDAFLGPGVVTTNDDAMGRRAPGEPLRGPTVRRAARVGGGVVLTPGIEIGEEAFIAAGAVVTRDVPARAVVMGVPAREVREVPASDLLAGEE